MSPEHLAKLAGGNSARVVVTGKDVDGEVDITDACHAYTFPQEVWYTGHDSPSLHAGSYLEFHTVLKGEKKLIAQYNLWGPAFDPSIVEEVKMFYLVVGQDHAFERETAFKLFTSCADAAWVDVVQKTPECQAWRAKRLNELGHSKSGASALGVMVSIALATVACNLF